MVARSSFLTMALAATASSVTGFSFPKECRSMTTELSATRRHFVSAATGAVLLAGTAGALPAFADVASGDSLPQGAQQFSTMIRVRKDLKVCTRKIQKAVHISVVLLGNSISFNPISICAHRLWQSASRMHLLK